MINYLKSRLRGWARRNLLTSNTIRYRVEFPRILDAFKLIGPQDTVFDGGAGAGQMLRLVNENGYCKAGHGFEYDPDLYKLLIANFTSLPGFTTEQGSLTEIPHKDESFDCVLSTQVLEHIVEHEKAASEMGRIVKRNGHLIISVPHPPEPYPNVGHVREGYTEADLEALFPSPWFERLSTSYSYTRPTVRRVMLAETLPFKGRFLPVGWADRETKLTDEQRKEQTPFVITCLFRKVQAPGFPHLIGGES
ncbi:MAG: class I SAM-dependent methyltransferase [Akkermansiaceae bacterium]|nr:class I SAM-dependent methyltransferase [Akkermansiaceae bacterium]